MTVEFNWVDDFRIDVDFGYLGSHRGAPPRKHNPQVVLNNDSASMLRMLREELRYAREFLFSVAFVSPRAIALLKQELIDFAGPGRIVTSDYLAFNSPAAFKELLNLRRVGIDVRLHKAEAFHPKGYVFDHEHAVTAIIGSSNLTENALVRNHEWNLKVSAAVGSDLAAQFRALTEDQLSESVPMTEQWVAEYERSWISPAVRERSRRPQEKTARDVGVSEPAIIPNSMQRDALAAIEEVRAAGKDRAIVISATGTGKTILSAFDVRSTAPRRMLFTVHREQILDRTIDEYRRVLGGHPSDYGKLTGGSRQVSARYLFASVQTLSRPEWLSKFDPRDFDYIVIDEAHRAAAPSYQRILNYFEPKFLLGMTATPERTDGLNVFELFDYNVPYEIRLNHALEEGMLSPFHYYGVTDVEYDDGTSVNVDTGLPRLVSPQRIHHIVDALETYSQAGVAPCGLIFCSRRDEAREISAALNRAQFRGAPLRTVALTGDDSIEVRERAVERLEAGDLDYIVTVDVFNEGVDIPKINQVVMLRQTQSAIVFVQQLGRGLRRAPGKEYLVVIDFIGNYANNYMIPIALFGDSSLSKESLRKNLIAAEERGVLPGLSSVRFDRIAQARVLEAIAEAKLDSMKSLKRALEAMRDRVGRTPDLWDFLRFESVDPVVLATKREHYPALARALLRDNPDLNAYENGALALLSHEVFPSKRAHEFILLSELLRTGSVSRPRATELFESAGLVVSESIRASVFESFTLARHRGDDRKKYPRVVVESEDGDILLASEFAAEYTKGGRFSRAVDDIVKTGMHLVLDRYERTSVFTRGMQYSRTDVAQLLGWARSSVSTIYGYRVDPVNAVCPLFITLHKSDDVSASTAYEDAFMDRSKMRYFSKNNRTLASADVRAMIEGTVALLVFVQKNKADEFFYLGQAEAYDPVQTKMTGDGGKSLPVVAMTLDFDEPIDAALFDYFHPTVTREG